MGNMRIKMIELTRARDEKCDSPKNGLECFDDGYYGVYSFHVIC